MSSQRPNQIPAEYPVSTPYTSTALAPPMFHSCPGSSIPINFRPEGPSMVDHYPHHQINEGTYNLCQRQLITFDMLPDDVLLEMFNFYVHKEDMVLFFDPLIIEKGRIEEWIKLAHVCQRWRGVVFRSPIRLNMRLVCTPSTPARDMLYTWPPLPLIIRDADSNYEPVEPFIADNIIAALEHNDRVCQIKLIFSELGYFTNLEAILKSFSVLTVLRLNNINPDRKEPERILPDSFLGGSAPRLELLYLHELSFPALPKLLLSTTHLVHLELSSIPRSGYIPPEAMATSLSTLTTLEFLCLCFAYPPPRPTTETRRRPLPPFTRSILPGLTRIEFRGASEYLEVILALIDTPRLVNLGTIFFNRLIFDIPQLFQFICRRPTLRAPEKCHITFGSLAIVVKFYAKTSYHYDAFHIGIRCTASEWQLSSLQQLCTSSLPPVSTIEGLYICEYQYDELDWQDDIENSLWLDLLRPFVAVKKLYISEEFAPRIAPALQELVGGRTTEVFPTLENIFLEGFMLSRPLHEGIEKFIAARSLASRPVVVSRWDREETR